MTMAVPGILATGESIARAQLGSGAVAWPDGHIDPWDHVECAMALSACGLSDEARRAYRWLRDTQRADGSWPRSTATDGTVTDHAAESHHAAYVAVGVWHEFLICADEEFTAAMWPVVRRATDWVLGLATSRGEIVWERDALGRPGRFALLSGCSSILQGLRCAAALAQLADDPRPDWELAADQLANLIAERPGVFADRSRFAMDWYYPVLSGALRGPAAHGRLADGWDTFVVDGLGVRCVSDQPWVTVAETCELVLSLDACGRRDEAVALFDVTGRLRHYDGSYWTGWQFANKRHFPDERSGWTAAAVVLAADALAGLTPASGIFRDAPAPRALAPGATGPPPPLPRSARPQGRPRDADRSM